MSLNVIDLIKSQFDPAFISQISTHLGESESGTHKAVGAILPAIIGGLANNSDKPGILDAILGSSSGYLFENLKNDLHNSKITTILTALFGDKLETIVNAISNFSGINNTSSSSLLNLVTSATIGSLGKYATENNLGTSGLSSLLSGQKGIVSSLLPTGLSFSSLGLGNWGQSETTVPEFEKVNVTSFDEPKVDVTRVGETHVNVESQNNNNEGSIWKWLIPLLLLFLAGWFLWNQINKTKKNNTIVTMTDTTNVKSDSSKTTIISDSTSINLPEKTKK
ncbi:DUF937 domain-containing protein [Halpernia sp.]|uniref:DUF937 domain-containing protein n=1 Tax=Halpernia sp. TaxID=2782209 RepID=UPI003A95B2A1